MINKFCKKCNCSHLLDKENWYFVGKYTRCKKSRLAYMQKYVEEHKEVVSRQKKDHYQENKEQYSNRMKSWRKEHREELNQYFKDLADRNPTRKVRQSLGARLYHTIKGKQKSTSIFKYLGCSKQELISHLESQFKVGMSWDNYGKYGWHIDHILPLASFDCSKEEDLLKAWNYTNLQPLWAAENLSKGSKVPSQSDLTSVLGKNGGSCEANPVESQIDNTSDLCNA